MTTKEPPCSTRFPFIVLFGICALLHSFKSWGYQLSQAQQEQVKKLAVSREWTLLLHMNAKTFGGWKSEADGADFFFSSEGKTNPEAEMLATIDHLASEKPWGRLQTPPQCAFPARTQFLFEQLQLHDQIERKKCPEFEQWLQDLGGLSATLIFSSYYAGNPASIFGHTLLRINSVSLSELEKNPHRLTDYGINFAAATDTDGGAMFAIKGLTGGYQGYFSLMPYYEKINEYVKNESRDLWEYHLSLTPAEIKTMLAHFWELGYNNHFDYFFIDENCSYQILWLLQVAHPQWDLTSNFPWYVLPADTIKVFHRYPDAIHSVHYRPSFSRLLQNRFEALRPDDKDLFFNLINQRLPPGQTQSKEALEAYTAFLRLKNFSDKGNPTFNEKTRVALLARSKLTGPSSYQEQTLIANKEEGRPDRSHHGQRIGISFKQNTSAKNKTLAINWKHGLHDLHAQETGYPPHSQIDFIHFKIKGWEDRSGHWKWGPEHFRIFDVTSLVALGPLQAAPSYRLGIGFEDARITPKNFDYVQQAHAGAGGTLSFFNNTMPIYGMFQLQSFAGNIPHTWQFGPGLYAGSQAQIYSFAKIWLEYESFFNMNKITSTESYEHIEIGLSFFPVNWTDLRLIADKKRYRLRENSEETSFSIEYSYVY